jgi:hypothetical protein
LGVFFLVFLLYLKVCQLMVNHVGLNARHCHGEQFPVFQGVPQWLHVLKPMKVILSLLDRCLLLLYLTCSVIQLVGTASKEPVFKRGDGHLHWAIGQFDYVLFQQMAKS